MNVHALVPAVALTALCLLTAPLSASAAGFTHESIVVDGRTRTFLVHVPDGWQSGDAPMPVIMGFHGKGGNGGVMKARFRNWANQGYILIFPDALRDPRTGTIHWNTRNANMPQTAWLDVDFVEALVARIDQLPYADANKIYATGFSSGGAMTWQLATDARSSRWFRAFAPVSSTLNQEKIDHADPRQPLTLIYIHGTADDNWWKDPVDPNRTTRWVVEHNRCDTNQVIERVYPDQGAAHPWLERGQLRREQTMVTAQYYPANPLARGGGGSVAFLTIVNGGHSWPKVFNAPNSPTHCRDVDAADGTIRFWQREADLP